MKMKIIRTVKVPTTVKKAPKGIQMREPGGNSEKKSAIEQTNQEKILARLFLQYHNNFVFLEPQKK